MLQRVHAEDRREQRRCRRQGADVIGDAVRHALALQAAPALLLTGTGYAAQASYPNAGTPASRSHAEYRG